MVDENKENQGDAEVAAAAAVVTPAAESEKPADAKLGDSKLANAKLLDAERADSDADGPASADIEKVTADLLQSRTDLLGRVQNLKRDLQDWRGKLDSQVKTYRQELGELRTTLNTEVEQLRNEFQSLRTTLKKQLDTTTGLNELGPTSSPEKPNPTIS